MGKAVGMGGSFNPPTITHRDKKMSFPLTYAFVSGRKVFDTWSRIFMKKK